MSDGEHAPQPPTVLQAGLRNTVAVIGGTIAGGVVNMGIIIVGATLLPPPPGVDVNDIETIKAHIGEYSFVQLMNPFVAHAAGTLVAAYLASKIGITRKFILAMISGCLFLLGGAMAVSMIPAPMWFNILDLTVAYLPLAMLGGWIATGGCCRGAACSR